MLRLVAYAPNGVRRIALSRRETVLGSAEDCDVQLPFPGVAPHHARVVREAGALRLEDLGSRKGVLLNGERVRTAPLEALDEIRLGGLAILVEDAGRAPAARPSPEPASEPPLATAVITGERLLAHVASVSHWVLADAESQATAESLISRLLQDFGGGTLLLLQAEERTPSIKLAVASESRWLAAGEDLLRQVEAHRRSPAARSETGAFDGRLLRDPSWIAYRYFAALDRGHVMITALPRFRPGEWSPEPGLWALSDLLVLGLVHHLGRYEPLMPGRGGQHELRLAPGLIVGESAAMKRLLEALRFAVDPPVPMLLRGEAGSGKELLARSVHLSGERRNGPFILGSAAGAAAAQVEADLFGAEVRGKGEPLRREGRLALAHGGTLFLDDVDELPLPLQARLVRFLRFGEVEPAGGLGARKVEVRVIAGSRGDLESLVARGLFRLDLAHVLGACAFDVPPLRERREDLPLLLQAFVNRFCHEAGKRVQGITVDVLSALAAYEFPGNLVELESIVRQLVYLCPAGEPIRHNLLPERLRSAPLQATARPAAASDLELRHWVGAAEEAAIREALQRTRGNKLRAAKLLGVSRAGLAMKMERYGLRARRG